MSSRPTSRTRSSNSAPVCGRISRRSAYPFSMGESFDRSTISSPLRLERWNKVGSTRPYSRRPDLSPGSIALHLAARAGGSQVRAQFLGARAAFRLDADPRPTHAAAREPMVDDARLPVCQDGGVHAEAGPMPASAYQPTGAAVARVTAMDVLPSAPRSLCGAHLLACPANIGPSAIRACFPGSCARDYPHRHRRSWRSRPSATISSLSADAVSLLLLGQPSLRWTVFP